MNVGFVNGRAKVTSSDGGLRYEVEASAVRSTEPHIEVHLQRQGDRALELDVRSSIAIQPKGRVLVARVDRTDGRSTLVSVQVR